MTSKIGDGDCSHVIKRQLLFGRKAMANLDSVLRNRDITFPTKVKYGQKGQMWSKLVAMYR